jgi:hypothetical protein
MGDARMPAELSGAKPAIAKEGRTESGFSRAAKTESQLCIVAVSTNTRSRNGFLKFVVRLFELTKRRRERRDLFLG